RGTARLAIGSDLDPALPAEDMARLKKHMHACFDSPGGEVTARANTAELGRMYLGLSEAGHLRFLKLLATEFDLDHKKLAELTAAYNQAESAAERLKLELALREALVTPRSTILRQFTALPDGFKFLINLRADLLPLIGKDAKLAGLEYDLKSILSAWFDVGLLDMQEITWNSPAALLEKLIEYEAVHSVSSWNDLKNRLDSDRRVFAFFHNKMPLEPLIFVHVALVQGMSDNIQVLLDESAPPLDAEKADTAIFYSITNAQKGLAGISFGNFLIKRVVSQLTEEMKQLKTFATLSPVPGFRAWLDPLLDKGDDKLLTDEEREALGGKKGATARLKSWLDDEEWAVDKSKAATLKPILLRLCAHYLANEKKGGKPRDPVAAFHLFNGARLERLNWLADTSSKGFRQSAAIMVNYYYKLDEIDDNHEEFVTAGKIVAGKQVKGYLK
ncbi:MAG: malonyl-CoA decarboxylase, partial [Proteobacteria bacterium]|nr:malonyl-CoA decarboxylase [Pseudomonadota bacterium]